MQFIRFLRRNEGVEAARKYFLDARKSPVCTYHVYVAYAMMAFCLDKDPKVIGHYFVEFHFFNTSKELLLDILYSNLSLRKQSFCAASCVLIYAALYCVQNIFGSGAMKLL